MSNNQNPKPIRKSEAIKMKKSLITSSVAALAPLCFGVTVQAQKGQEPVQPDAINLNSSKSNIYRDAPTSPTPSPGGGRAAVSAAPGQPAKATNLNLSRSNTYRAQASPTPAKPAINLNSSKSNIYRAASPTPKPAKATTVNVSKSNNYRVASPSTGKGGAAPGQKQKREKASPTPRPR